MDGIGYVWIIRVFLVVSILTPWLIRLNEVVKKEVYFFFLILVVITIQEVLIGLGVGMSITFFGSLCIMPLDTRFFFYLD